jgi:DNA (cytosine-5)-methyltransferase 1
MKYKILNLYACLGGNRYKWDEVANIQVTAVELDPEAARLYQERFPNDQVIVADAHQYLLDHYKKFDFIWSSPPCPTHSKIRFIQAKSDSNNSVDAVYPNMSLYEEIILLQHYFKGKYVVENVTPYYEPLIFAQKRGRHLYWTNFTLPFDLNERKLDGTLCEMKNELKTLCDFHDYDFRKYKGEQSVLKMARNLVDYEAGLTILNTAIGIITKSNTKQLYLFQ